MDHCAHLVDYYAAMGAACDTVGFPSKRSFDRMLAYLVRSC